jgi:hypothetical protein
MDCGIKGLECQIKACTERAGASDVICREHWIAALQRNQRPVLERVGEHHYKLVGWQEVRPGEVPRNLPL